MVFKKTYFVYLMLFNTIFFYTFVLNHKEKTMANEHINWYPGHMKKTRELIQENLKLINAAVEIRVIPMPRSAEKRP